MRMETLLSSFDRWRPWADRLAVGMVSLVA